MKKEYLINGINSIINDKLLFFLLLFLISFVYTLFFTACVPFFFDDHEFHRDYVGTSYKDLTLQLFSLNNGGISDGPRPVYGFFFKFLFPFIGYNYCQWRMVKALIFSIFILLFYLLAKNLLQKKSIAFFCTVFIMTLFPTFLQQFGYNGPHIFAELFKISAILLFLYDIERKKTSWTLQGAIFFCSLFAIRVYPPGYSIAAILPLFTLLYCRQKIIRYILLFFLIFLIQFPITFQLGALDPNSTGTYSPKLINFKWFIINDFWKNITSPLPSMSYLYYKSFTAILTFFGFWLIVGCLLTLAYKYTKKKIKKDWRLSENASKEVINEENTLLLQKKTLLLGSVWFLCELPYYIFLPEHAVRYSFALFIPFSLLTSLLIMVVLAHVHKGKRIAAILIILLVFGAILTNISYTYAFRAGWGSSFFTFENVMDYMAEQHFKTGKSIGVLYFAGSAADEYKFVNKSSTNYTFGTGVVYIKTIEPNDFTKERIAAYASQYDRFFVLKRTTSLSKTAYPDIDFSAYQLKEVIFFEGVEQTLFDTINDFVMRIIKIPYEPNKVIIYQYEKEDS